jgi:hypothetical protein
MAFWAHFEVAGRRRGREGKREGEGGSGRGRATRRGAALWGLAPTGGRLERGAPRARCRPEPERLNLTGGPWHSAGRQCH